MQVHFQSLMNSHQHHAEEDEHRGSAIRNESAGGAVELVQTEREPIPAPATMVAVARNEAAQVANQVHASLQLRDRLESLEERLESLEGTLGTLTGTLETYTEHVRTVLEHIVKPVEEPLANTAEGIETQIEKKTRRGIGRLL